MLFLIFLILLIVGVSGFIVYTNKKLLLIKQQLSLSNNQINSLKNKLARISPKGSLKLKFLTPPSKGGIIKKDSNVLIAPFENSLLLHKPNVKMEVYIIDMVQNSDIIWYYVALPLENNINSRGWIKASDFSILYSNSQDICKK